MQSASDQEQRAGEVALIRYPDCKFSNLPYSPVQENRIYSQTLSSDDNKLSDDLAKIREDIANLRLRIKASAAKRKALSSETDRFAKKVLKRKE